MPKNFSYSEDTAADRLAIVQEFRRTQERETFRIEMVNPDDPRLEALIEAINRARDIEDTLQEEVGKTAPAPAATA